MQYNVHHCIIMYKHTFSKQSGDNTILAANCYLLELLLA